MSFVLLKIKTISNKVSALHILKEEGLIMKLFGTIFMYSLFIFVERFNISHTRAASFSVLFL